MRTKSILQPDASRKTRKNRKCYITGRTKNLNLHHIYPGPNRKTSDKHGFWVYLWEDLHNGNNPEAVHKNPNQGLDLQLKKACQIMYERTHSREEFIGLIGRSYL